MKKEKKKKKKTCTHVHLVDINNFDGKCKNGILVK